MIGCPKMVIGQLAGVLLSGEVPSGWRTPDHYTQG